ncbi:hypothetical protein [Mongoliitalea lutea]|nr:hypothetical protein [Mongoliitalea lutea]
MKNKVILLFSITLMAFTTAIKGQNNPYEAINNELPTPVEVSVLWPWEDGTSLLGFKNAQMKVSYKIEFSEKENSNLIIDFNKFDNMQSATFSKNEVSGKFLLDKLNQSLGNDFNPVFEQIKGETIYYMLSNENVQGDDLYFLATGKETYELLYFKYKRNTKDSKKLQFQLKEILND